MDPNLGTAQVAGLSEAADSTEPTQADAIATEVVAESTNQRLATIQRLQGSGLLGLLIVMCVVSAIFVHGFATSYNIETVLRNVGFLGFAAIGMTFMVATGNFIDLSVVAQIAAAGLLTTSLEPHGLVIALLGAVASCLAFAAVNWVGVGLMGANCVIVTLGIETAGMGVIQDISNGNAYTGTSSALHSLMTTTLGPVPVEFLMLLALVAGAHFILTRLRVGYGIRAIGANKRAASLSGVRSGMVLAFVFAIVSLTFALTGIAIAGFNGGALANMGTGYDFNALAAVVVGGNSLLGGEGWPLRTLVGVLFVEVLNNIVVLVGLAYTWQQVALGVAVIVSVGIDAYLRKAQAR